MAKDQEADLMTLTADLVSAFVSNNSIRSGDLPDLIKSTHTVLAGLTAPTAPQESQPEFIPAVSARKSLSSREHIISMIDGKPYKSLKRHLSAQGLTPDQYRERYNLRTSYPMVAPAYSEKRREVAKRLGLGRKDRDAAASPKIAPATRRRAKPAAR